MAASDLTWSALERTYYFANELLDQNDFNREHAYLYNLITYQSRSLFTPGVLDGLAVTGKGTPKASVGVGAALDDLGQLSVVPADTLDLPIPSPTSAGSYQLVMLWSTNATERPSILQVAKKILEKPTLQLVAAGAAPVAHAVPLAKLQLDASGNITDIDLSVRQACAPRNAPAAAASADVTQTIQQLSDRVAALEQKLATTGGGTKT